MPADTTAQLDERLEVARAATLEAGRLLAGHFRRPVRSEYKRGDSMVSEVDHAAEDLLRSRIGAAFPGDSILGEERGYQVIEGSPWCWTLDPLDGTQNFLAGVPVFAAAVSVLYQRAPVVAVIQDVMREELYVAVRGRGAQRNGVPIRVNPAGIGRSSLVAVRHGFLRQPAEGLYDLFPTRKFRSLGSMCIELCLVASGAIEALVADRPHLWDIAPGALLVEEAGGVMRTFGGDAVFPLAEDPGLQADRRYRIAAGGPQAVAGILGHLRNVGV